MLEGGGGATGLLNKGGGSNRLPGLVAKQQAVEFPQVQASIYNLYYYRNMSCWTFSLNTRTRGVATLASRLQATVPSPTSPSP